MKKIICLTFILTFCFQTPANAGWLNVVMGFGEVIIKKIDSFAESAVDEISSIYHAMLKKDLPSSSETTDVATSFEETSASIGNAIKYGGYKVPRIGVKILNNCSKGYERLQLLNEETTFVYEQPNQKNEPIGYYKEQEQICLKITQPITDLKPRQDGQVWYKSNDGWYLGSSENKR